MGSKRPFGSILEGSGKVWERFWEGLGKHLEDFTAFEQVLGRFWTSLTRFGLAGADSLNRTPALIREASQCVGVLLQRDKTESLEHFRRFLDSK